MSSGVTTQRCWLLQLEDVPVELKMTRSIILLVKSEDSKAVIYLIFVGVSSSLPVSPLNFLSPFPMGKYSSRKYLF